MKRSILLAASIWTTVAAAQPFPAEQHPDRVSLWPRYREWAVPSQGVVVRQNPPALLWPSGGKNAVERYVVEWSDSPDFPADRTRRSEQEWAAYTPH